MCSPQPVQVTLPHWLQGVELHMVFSFVGTSRVRL